MKKTWLVMTATGSLVFLSLVFFIMFAYYPKVYKGITIEGIDVSGCSREEIIGLLSFWQKEYQNKTIVMYYGDKMFTVDAASIDFEIDIDSTLDEVWNYGRTGMWWKRFGEILIAVRNGHAIPFSIKYNELKLNELIERWQDTIQRPPRNAALSLATGDLVPEQQGYSLESDALRPLVLRAFVESDMDTVALPVTTLYPQVTTNDIVANGIHEVLSRYTTVFNSDDVNRTTNIKIAALKINGYIVYPGKVFSFNDVVGPREKKYGFKEAMEIIDGEFVQGIGGGVCQLSSTLYNAVILANLGIVERSSHSKVLSYVPLGRDATVVFGGLDFKFVNNTTEPLMVMAEVNSNKSIVGIVGQHSIAESVEILSVEKKEIPPVIIKQDDENLYLGETKIDKQGKPGYDITTIRVVRLRGQEIKREILSSDHYLPEDTIMKMGTQIPPFMSRSY